MTESQTAPTHHTHIIVGAGPAGLQMAYCLEQGGQDYLVLEAGESVGTFFRKFPRHRKLISINKVSTGFDDPEINLRWDWNSLLDDGTAPFKQHSRSYFPPADAMVGYLETFAARHALKIRCNTRVVKISRPEGRFLLRAENGELFSCDRLIVGTGVSIPHIPDFPGAELAEGYAEVSVDPEEFRDQRVMIVGKGNSAFETADNLVETTSALHMASPKPIRLAWKTHFVGHLRAVNNNLLDTYQLKSQNTILDCEIVEIRKSDDGNLIVRIAYTHASGQILDIPVHRVILCTGFRFDASIFDESCKPELVIKGKVPGATCEWESTNVPDLFFIGTLMQARDYHKSFSAFIHGFRYNVKALSQVLACKYDHTAWPSVAVKTKAEDLRDILLDRVHANSALFQQPEFFCDVIGEGKEGGGLRYYRDVPVDYVREGKLGEFRDYYTLTLEYGHEEHHDPFNIVRIPERGDVSAFIHPVVRRFRNGEKVAEYHIPEDLENTWRDDMYLVPFLAFLQDDLAARAAMGGAPEEMMAMASHSA